MIKNSILLCFIVLISSCASTRMMKQQTEYEILIKRLVLSDNSVEAKVDGVAQVFDDVLQHSMSYSSNKRTLKHINQFTQNNKETLNVLLNQIEDELSGMNAVEQVQFSVKILKKPYIKSFIDVVPKVEKKIDKKLRQIQMFGRFIKILKPSLF